MPEKTTVGRLLVQDALPEDMQADIGVLDKAGVRRLFTRLAEQHPDEYVDTLHRLMSIAADTATTYGGEASVSLEDLRTPPQARAYRKQLQARLDAIYQDPKLTPQQKNEQVMLIMRRAIPVVGKKVEQEAFERGNRFAKSIRHGFRGSPAQLRQLLFGDMLVVDHKERPLPVAGLHGYGEGVTPVEYWANAYGSRKGFFDVQFATASTGYFGKQLALMLQKQRITGEDCGASDVGMPVPGDDPDIIGKTLARPAGGLKAGTVLSRRNLQKLTDEDEVWVRSPVTCQQEQGLCQKCAGKRADGRYPPLGASLGIEAARGVAEPLMQIMGLSAKHVGGQVGDTDEHVSGFEEVNRFLQVPKNFKGEAVLAPKDGVVEWVLPAAQGGHYVRIGGERLYVPPHKPLTVKRGDRVEQGDALSEGTPNPAKVASLKGLSEGRQYFIKRLGEILERNGVGTHRSNLEHIARGFFDKARVTRPEGVAGYVIGETVPYSTLQRRYKPRKDAEDRTPDRSRGMYLEKPVLHYTIGTRITPSIVSRLRKAGVKQVSVHNEDPGFEPHVVRLMAATATDPDWKTRMAGFNLKRTFLDAATHGAESRRDDPSYVGPLMDPERL